MKKYIFCSVVILFPLIIGYHIVCLWRAMALCQGSYTEERLLLAARIDPSNPDPYGKLAVLHQWNLLQVDLKKSVEYLHKAIERNPLEQEYWLSLARLFRRRGESIASERALNNAILVSPTSYQGRWIAGNLLLQHGAFEKALPHFSYILSHYPNQGSLIYDVWRKAIDDPDFVLEELIPEDPSSLNQYLGYLYEVEDKESAKKTWAKLAALGYKADRPETIRHIDFLISSGELTEASQIWTARLREEGLPVSSDGNLVTNGGFERDEVLGGGFDWRIGAVSGAEISFDHTVAFEGEGSLKISFSGEKNVNFQHVYQFLAWKPDTNYVLAAHMKTAGVTTKSGLRIEVLAIGPGFHGTSKSLTGDNGWTELTVPFRTPPHSQGGVIRVRRQETDKFDRFISGTVWIDNVQIKEIQE